LLDRVEPKQKSALLRVLGVIGGSSALEAVRAEVNNSNETVRAAAIRSLCGWKTADAAPHLLALAKESSNPAQKTSALRGYINLVRDESLSNGKKIDMCRQAKALIQRNEEKKLLLGVLGTIPSTEALSMASTYMADGMVRNEAYFSVLAIGDKIVLQHPDEVADAVRRILNNTKSRNITSRARNILNKAK
jgi:HEAT repeat protein